MLQVQAAGLEEEILILGIRPRPPALNIIDTQFIKLPGNNQLVLDGEGDGLALSAVAQSGIEYLDFHAGTPASFLRFRNVIMLRSSTPTLSIC